MITCCAILQQDDISNLEASFNISPFASVLQSNQKPRFPTTLKFIGNMLDFSPPPTTV